MLGTELAMETVEEDDLEFDERESFIKKVKKEAYFKLSDQSVNCGSS
jgi:hypothetical protein